MIIDLFQLNMAYLYKEVDCWKYGKFQTRLTLQGLKDTTIMKLAGTNYDFPLSPIFHDEAKPI